MSILYNDKGEEDEEEIVSINNLNLKNGSDIILDNVSFKIKKGDFLGIIGPNGAGKTTLFKCMLGLNKNFSGTIRIFNKDVKKEYKKIYKKIGYIPQKNNFNPQLQKKIKEIKELGTKEKKKLNKDTLKEIVEFTGIAEYLDKRIGDLSGGQQQRVMITKALINEPELLILD